MSNETDNLITLTVAGVESEHGHLRADEFIDKLTHLISALNGIDKIVGETASPSLYYRVVDTSHSSPLKITLEPVVRRNFKKRISPDHIRQTHSRFFGEISTIREKKCVSPDIDNNLLEHLRDLALGVDQDFKDASLSNGHSRVPLDQTFEKNIQQILKEEEVSYGGLEGKLDAVNIHETTRRFWIYPKIGVDRVRCDFLPGTSDEIRQALGQYVRVTGLKFFRSTSPFPFRIKVNEFQVIADANKISLEKIGGIAPKATGEMSSVEFIRKIRDEWD